MLRALLVAGLVLVSGQAYADRAQERTRAIYPIIQMKAGTPYADLRWQAIQNGFRPVVNKNRYGRCIDKLKDYCDKYPEALACLSDGEADCRFLLSFQESWFIVKTIGAPGELKITNVEWLDPAERREVEQSMKWRY